MIKLNISNSSGDLLIGNLSEGDNNSVIANLTITHKIKQELEDEARSKGVAEHEVKSLLDECKKCHDKSSLLDLVKNNYSWAIDLMQKLI